MFGTLLAIVMLGVCIGLYLLPVIIGTIRGAPDISAIAVVDVLLGWTFIGWVVALAMAFRTVRPGSPVVQVVQNAPSYLPPNQGGGWGASPNEPPTGSWAGSARELPGGGGGGAAGGGWPETPAAPPADWTGWSADVHAGWAGPLGPPPPRDDVPPPLALPDKAANPAETAADPDATETG